MFDMEMDALKMGKIEQNGIMFLLILVGSAFRSIHKTHDTMVNENETMARTQIDTE